MHMGLHIESSFMFTRLPQIEDYLRTFELPWNAESQLSAHWADKTELSLLLTVVTGTTTLTARAASGEERQNQTLLRIWSLV